MRDSKNKASTYSEVGTMNRHLRTPGARRRRPRFGGHPSYARIAGSPRLPATLRIAFVVTVLVITGVLLNRVAPAAADTEAGGKCSQPPTDDGPLEVTKGAILFSVHYANGICSDIGDVIPLDRAQGVLDTVGTAYDWYTSFSFLPPYVSTLPCYHVYVYDIAKGAGATHPGCFTINAPSFRCDSDDLRISKTTQHEFFHTEQRAYWCLVGDCNSGGIGPTFGGWVSEGQARCTDDRFSDDLDSATFSNSFRFDIKSTFRLPERSLFDHSYYACLFWSYCCQEFGAETGEPEAGLDFLRMFWEQIRDLVTTDGAAALDSTIAAAGGGSLDDVYLDFAIANYAHGLDLSAVSQSDKYIFDDEQQAIAKGESAYPSVDTISASIPENACGDAWPSTCKDNNPGQYAFHVYEATVGSSACTAVGFRGESRDDCSSDDDVGAELGWAVLGVTSDGRVTGLSKGQGQEFGRTFVISDSDPISEIVAVVVGLSDATEFEYWFDSGALTITIDRPTAAQPAYPGPADSPGRFLVRLFAEGPADLEPSGVGRRSVLGLKVDDFSIQVGSEDATVLTAAYISGEYWLVVQAPVQASDGIYDQTVNLCEDQVGAVEATNADSVLYGDIKISHMVVIDTSGSMGSPSGNTKLDAAKNAASLYIDAVSDDDRVGLVAFNGNAVDCDDSTALLEALGDATAAKRAAAKTGVAALAAGGNTSIGDGLWKAQDQLDLFLVDTERHTVLLLSDGKENEARYWDTVAGCATAGSRIVPEDTIVNAIAFGPDSNQSQMEDIAAATDGDYGYVDVTTGAISATGPGIASITNNLADAYMDGLQRARRMQRMFFDSGVITGGFIEFDIPITEAAPEATFFFNVDDPGANLNVELRDPTGIIVTPPIATDYVTSTHKVYHLNVPLMLGNWRVRLNVVETAEYIAGVLARDPFGAELLLRFSQINKGGLTGEPDQGRFELGRPVTILAIFTDSSGPILGAQIDAVISKPDGSTSCGMVRLFDDGTHGDGASNDGVYGAIFTETWRGTAGGVDNDDQGPPKTVGVNGSYLVKVTATFNQEPPFTRIRNGAFQVFASPGDQDKDSLPDTWEVQYGTDPMIPDAGADPDFDGLINMDEFEQGTDPNDPDTDNGGEMDGSEASAGRCPLDASDDALPPPLYVEVVTDTGDEGTEVLDPGAILLLFPWHPSYQEMRIFRAVDAPTGLLLYQTLNADQGDGGNYYDTAVEPGRQYFYRFQPVGAGGAIGRPSNIISGVVTPPNCHPIISELEDPENAQLEGFVDIVAAQVKQEGSVLTFSITTPGGIPKTLPQPDDRITYLWLIDADQDAQTGQPHGEIGTEFNVRAVIGETFGGGFVDVVGNLPGGGQGTVTVEGNTIAMAITLDQIGNPSQFNWRSDAFSQIGETGSGNGETAVASATILPAACDAPPVPPPCVNVAGPLGNRYIRADCPGSDPGEFLRVRLVDLDGYPVPTEDILYVGPPYQAPDEDLAKPGQTFTVAPLQCDPYPHNWSAEGTIAIYGAEILPDAEYELQRAAASCPDLSDPACWSTAITITTAKYGDIWPLFSAPGNSAQPDFKDIAAMVRKFQATGSRCSGGANDSLVCANSGDCPSGTCEITAPLKATCQLQPNVVFPKRRIDFKDIARDVDAFVGTPYAASTYGPCPCPSAVTCGATACINDLDCGTGLCVDGFCGDECGRCTP